MTEDHAIRDCESRLRDEYKLSDFRHEQAEQVMDVGHHYKVKGHTKVDGKRYPLWALTLIRNSPPLLVETVPPVER
jgi:hypothetical protein